jgi:hypothetical protein
MIVVSRIRIPGREERRLIVFGFSFVVVMIF